MFGPKRIGIIASRAVSLREVARDIAYVAQRQKLTPIMLDYTAEASELSRMFDRGIVVMAWNPLYVTPYALLVRDLNRLKTKTIMYTTTEGEIPKRFVHDWEKREVPLVANSEYTRRKLVKVGLNVIDVVPHGVNFEVVEKARPLVDAARRMLREKLGDGVYFVTVASAHPRKGLARYAKVVAKAREKCKECKFWIVTQSSAKSFFNGIDGVFVDTGFGKRSKTEIFALLGAADWYVQPTLAEGFGLPVLEAMAMGTPVVHTAYEPLTEFTEPSANILVRYEDVKYDTFGEGLYYELHLYDINDFVDAILEAYDIAKNRREEYEERSKRVEKHARQYDVVKVYTKLLKIVRQ